MPPAQGGSMNPYVAVYAIVVGVLMVGFWGFLVATERAELDQRPWDMGFHLAAEFGTALLLIAAGAGSFLGLVGTSVVMPIALGMLLYSVVNSPGFYAGKRNWPIVDMFMVLTVLTLAAIVSLLAVGF